MEVQVIVGDDPIVRRAAQLAARLASTSHAVFISGESGSGRGHFARFLHARGPRAVAPFSKFEFGAAVRGACLEELAACIAAAAGGTLVLENCEALSGAEREAVAALLRRADVTARVILLGAPAPSTAAGAGAVDVGAATADLATRLDALMLYLPPLRLRRADVPPLARHFAGAAAAGRDAPAPSFSDAAMLGLWHYSWPGNVGELRDEVRAAVERCDADVIDPTHLPARLFPGPRRADARIVGGGNSRLPLRSRDSALFA